MASAQVLPSKKKGHLEAGKRRLEEFRKKKAEERLKKAGSTVEENASTTNRSSDGATTSEVVAIPNDLSSVVSTGNVKATDVDPVNGASEVNYNALSGNLVQKPPQDLEPKWLLTSGVSGPLSTIHDPHSDENNIYRPSYTASETQVAEDDSYLRKYLSNGPSTAANSFSSIFPKKFDSVSEQREFGFTSTSNSGNTSSIYEEPVTSPNFDGGSIYNKRFSGSNDNVYNIANGAWSSLEASSKSSSSDFNSFPNHIPLHSAVTETGTRRNRPSFLDSIVPKVSSGSHPSFTHSPEVEPYLSRGADNLSFISQQSFPNNLSSRFSDDLKDPDRPNPYETWSSSLVSATYVPDQLKHGVFNNPSLKKEDDFSGLEQLIEDLTQEKFSLQRSLEASRVLAESLVNENSSLTDSYNQQGAAVNQLKTDMERLHDEIRAQLLELDSIKMEYANAQLECSAADERAKLLASEVISLEEKALKLRSSELKLERQLEKSNDEIFSYRKKVSSLEKERQDLQLTIDALREEKKLMQTKLRIASSERPAEVLKSPVTKSVLTSTEDLGVEISELIRGSSSDVEGMPSTSDREMQNVASSSSSYPSLHEAGEFNLPASRVAIPVDQLRAIGNINSLISALALEKEELVRALTSESSQSLKLKELNKELSRKLEAQTQRLELLTAQTMASENVPGRAADSQPIHDIIIYTDEGDEVVERVLGWIMKLFPGGPSKRRTSKLL